MINDKWECFLCGREDDFEILPSAYLSNYHPLCSSCADDVFKNEKHKQRFRLTYHQDTGDIILASNVPVPTGHYTKN